MHEMTRIGLVVRSARLKQGVTQESLAQQLDWKQPMLSRLEKGQRHTLKADDIEKLLAILDIQIDELFVKPYYSQKNVTLFKGDAERILMAMEDESIDCVVTSPPYYGQRDYEVDEQIGLESHPNEYIDRLLEVFFQIKRVLKSTGSVWVNIGDTYWSGKGKSQGIDRKQKHRRFSRPQDKTGEPPLCVSKQRLLIPHRFAIAMQEQGWIVRNDNVWYKSNPTPDPVSDRCSIVHEYVFHFVKQRKYYFDAAAVAVPSNGDKETKPPPSVWEISTNASSKNHKAVFPEELVRLPIRATCPSDGKLLDPFCGTGTALYVALVEQVERQVIGIDLSRDALDEAKVLLEKLL